MCIRDSLTGGEQSYMGFDIDSGAAAPEYSGDCDSAAFWGGVAEMGDFVSNSPWGIGYGPMTSDFEDELSEALGSEWTALGDTAGTSYLKWDNADGTTISTWGYFQVYGFGEGNLVDFSGEPTAGVRDSSTPADGYYYNNTVYILTFG